MSKPKTILFFVEDPGAANMLPSALEKLLDKDVVCVVIADGAAYTHLQQRDIDCIRPPADTAEDILTLIQPDAVVVGTAANPETLGLAIVDEARKRSLPNAGFVDGPENSELRWSGETDNPLAYAPDVLMVPSDYERGAFEEIGYPSAAIHVVGYPQLHVAAIEAQALSAIGHKSLRNMLFPEAGERKIFVFLTEPVVAARASEYERTDDYLFVGRGRSNRRCDIIIEEFLHAVGAVEPKPYTILRLHPRNTREEFSAYEEAFDVVSQAEAPLEVIFAADAVIGMTTMLLAESLVLGRPTLAVLPRAIEEEWLPRLAIGRVPCVRSRAQLQAALQLLAHGERLPMREVGMLNYAGHEAFSEVVTGLIFG